MVAKKHKSENTVCALVTLAHEPTKPSNLGGVTYYRIKRHMQLKETKKVAHIKIQ